MDNLTPEEIQHLRTLARREQVRANWSRTCLFVCLALIVASGVLMFAAMEFLRNLDISQVGR